MKDLLNGFRLCQPCKNQAVENPVFVSHSRSSRSLAANYISPVFGFRLCYASGSYGLAKKPEAKGLQKAVVVFLLRVKILPWDSAASRAYG